MEALINKKIKINPWLIAAVVMFPTAIEILDTTVANVALPYIAGGLGSSVDESTWVLTSYIISNAIMLPITYWFSDRLGRKTYLLASIIVFTISSMMCGMSTSLGELIFFRILQGAGGGGLTPLSQSILLDVFPKEKHGQAMGFFGFGILVAPIIGPFIGGWLADNYTWNWIFFINIPLGIIAFILVKLLIPKSFNDNKKKSLHIDFIGLSFLILFISSMQIVLDKGQECDWFASNFIIFFFVLMVVGLVLLIFWVINQKHPIINLKVFKDFNYSMAVVVMFIRGFVFYGFGVMYPLFLEKLLGYTATVSGEVNMFSGIAVMIMMPIIGWLTSKVNPKHLALAGIAISCYALLNITNYNIQINFGTFILNRCLFGIGTALIFIPINTIAFASVKKEHMTECTGLSNLARSIGGSIGISVSTTLSIRRAQLHQNILVNHTDSLSHQFVNYFNAVQNSLQASAQSSYQVIYNIVQQQATLLAYLDVFQLMLLLVLLMTPFVVLIRKMKEPLNSEVKIHH